MRPLFVLLHRWFGLTIAGFLFITGITGSIISWDHELDDLLNPHLTKVSSHGETISSLELAPRIEAADPRAWVTFIPLLPEEGKSLAFGVQPRVNPETGQLYQLGYNQVFVDPVTGKELGKREWGAVSLAPENFVSFLYKLHFTLHMPEIWGIDEWGIWLLGVIAIIWTVDCFNGFFLTLPAAGRSREENKECQLRHSSRIVPLKFSITGLARGNWWLRWQPAWRVRWRGGRYKVNFDLHRAGSLWTWMLLFIIAFTAFSLNLNREVFLPVMTMISEVMPNPEDFRTPASKQQPIVPIVGYASVIADAREEAARRKWPEPAGSIYYDRTSGIYGVDFHYPGEDHGAAGVGPARLYFDSQDGRYLGDTEPWKGTAADIFLQMQFPLHSGRILGLPGRILISVMGLVVAMLSVTGVYIWWIKRRSRKFASRRLRRSMGNTM
jgi:uncharacterized iron-regulated membrane protein